MKLSGALASALLASVSLAAPLTEKRWARHEARRAQSENLKTQPPMVPGTNEVLHIKNTTQVQYSSNWAGAVLIGNGYTAVTAEFVVPTPRIPPGGSSYENYCASAWVGIDGDTCTSAILQTGVDFCVQGGSPYFEAWYEWFPDYMYTFRGISMSAGDTIRVTVDAYSQVSGTATVENLSNGESRTHTFNGNVQGDLCDYNAEWIVEDFSSGGSLVPFADFGTVTFTGAEATDNGRTVGPSGAAILDIRQNGQVLTSASASGNSVTVRYV